MNGRYWTPDEDRRLAVLFPDHDDAELGPMFGRNKEGVRLRRLKLGLHRPPCNQHTRKKPAAATVVHQERRQRLSTVITRIEAYVPVGLVLGDVIGIGERDLVVIAYNPDCEMVCVDAVTREVVVVGSEE